MFSNINWDQIITELALAIIPVLGSWLTYLVHQAAKWIKEQTRIPMLDKYIDILDQAVEITVKALMPYVDDLKQANKNGKLTPEQISRVRQEALNSVNSQLCRTARKVLKSIYHDLDSTISNKLEAKLFDVKLLKENPGQYLSLSQTRR